MGTNNSKLKICKVTPIEEQHFCQTASRRIITSEQHFQHQQGSLRHRQTSQLSPLKQHVPQIVPSSPDLQNLYSKPIHSIINSHPPQRTKTWQPIPCRVEPPAASKTSDNHISMGWRNGVVTQYSTPSQGGRCAAGSSLQRNKGGFLQAQTLLIGQATKKRQSHQKHLREQRRTYTSSGAGNMQIGRIHLVSRPTERDIFWDETKGQNLDLRELLQPSPPLTATESDTGMEEMTRQPNSEVGLKVNFGSVSRDLNESATNSPSRIIQQNLPRLDDFQKHEQRHLNTWDVQEDWWGHREKEE